MHFVSLSINYANYRIDGGMLYGYSIIRKSAYANYVDEYVIVL